MSALFSPVLQEVDHTFVIFIIYPLTMIALSRSFFVVVRQADAFNNFTVIDQLSTARSLAVFDHDNRVSCSKICLHASLFHQKNFEINYEAEQSVCG